MRLASLICVAALAFCAAAHADETEDAAVNVGKDLVAAKACKTDAVIVARAQAAFDRALASDAVKDKEGLKQKIAGNPLATDMHECQLVPSLLGNHLSILSSLTAPDVPAVVTTVPFKAPYSHGVLMAIGFATIIAMILGIAAALEIYMAPYLTALFLRKRKTDRVLLMNLLLGWTVIGWVVALIWAVEEDKPTPDEQHAARLARLSGLRASGQLTAEEFDILKARSTEMPA